MTKPLNIATAITTALAKPRKTPEQERFLADRKAHDIEAAKRVHEWTEDLCKRIAKRRAEGTWPPVKAKITDDDRFDHERAVLDQENWDRRDR